MGVLMQEVPSCLELPKSPPRELFSEILRLDPVGCGMLRETLKQAAERIGISKAWASRLHAKTLKRLAHALRGMGIDDV